MKLLLDQNLPRSLLHELHHQFPESDHVGNLGLADASDTTIFDHARQHGFTILSKDSDFRQLSFLRGAPPKVVWLRVGNCTVAELRRTVRAYTEALRRFETAAESFLVIEPGEIEDVDE
jgi:predicted nuclease of predicted toxin-antitoxin system